MLRARQRGAPGRRCWAGRVAVGVEGRGVRWQVACRLVVVGAGGRGRGGLGSRWVVATHLVEATRARPSTRAGSGSAAGERSPFTCPGFFVRWGERLANARVAGWWGWEGCPPWGRGGKRTSELDGLLRGLPGGQGDEGPGSPSRGLATLRRGRCRHVARSASSSRSRAVGRAGRVGRGWRRRPRVGVSKLGPVEGSRVSPRWGGRGARPRRRRRRGRGQVPDTRQA